MEKIDVNGSTVDFFKTIENGLTTYQFDTSRCGPPEPMVNAMVGLQLLDNDSQLIMINHKSPGGLFPKIQNDFDIEESVLDDGRAKVIFRKKTDAKNTTDFSNNTCG